MNRGLAGFVGFCVALGFAALLLVWWLGLPLVKLAMVGGPEGKPYYLLYLRHPSSATATVPSYDGEFLRLLAAEDTPLTWRAGEVEVLHGSIADEWGQFDRVTFADTRRYVRLATSSVYRDVAALAPQGKRLAVGTIHAPHSATPAYSNQLLLLAQTNDRAALDAWLQPLLALGGQLLWDAQVAVLEESGTQAPAAWNALLLVGFNQSQEFAGWLHSVDAQTDIAVLQSKSDAVNLWLLRSPGR